MSNEDYFMFLDELRESGRINMFLAPRVLENHFGITSKEAHNIFWAWCATFDIFESSKDEEE